MSRSERLAQPNLPRALGHGYQHDVDNSNRAQSQRNYANHAEKIVHAIKNLSDLLVILNRVPIFKRFFKLGIKAMVPRDNLVHFLFRDHVICRHKRTIVQK